MRAILRLVRLLFVCIVVVAVAGGAAAGLTIWYFGRDLPNFQQLEHYEPPITTRLQAGLGYELGDKVVLDRFQPAF